MVQVAQARALGGDPARSFLFEVSSMGIRGLHGGFSRVSGLKEEIEVVDARDGTDPLQTRKLHGIHSGGEATFERGVIDNLDDLIGWYNDMKNAVPGYKTDLSVNVFSPAGPGQLSSPRTVTLKNAWPSSYELGELDAKGSGVALESLTVVFESLNVQ